MDDEDIVKSFTNIPKDSDNVYDSLTSGEIDSTCEFHDSSKEEENIKSDETRSDVSGDSLKDKILVSEIDSKGSEINNTNGADKAAENKELANFYDRGSNDKEAKNETVLPNAQLASASNNIEEDVNTGLVLGEKITLIEESADSNSENEILTKKDSEIELDDENEIVFDPSDGNSLIDPASNSEIASDKKDIVEIVPDNVSFGQCYNVKPNSDLVDTLVAKISDNDEEQTIFNCEDRILKTNLQSSLDRYANFTTVENKTSEHADNQTSATDDLTKSNSPDYLIRSKSVAELSTARVNKSHSLAEDAKLVKFSVSSKSVNIMQSNAQFLNKSRNFLNFITEKSTNIMEKTLLPQNLAAKYNSMLRLTEHNPPNGKKFIEEAGATSDSVEVNPTLNSSSGSEVRGETSIEIPFNVTKLDIRDTETTNSHSKERDEFVPSNYGAKEECIKDNGELFLKCTANENKSDHVFTPKMQNTEIASADINSGYDQSNYSFVTANIKKEGKIHNLDFGGTEKIENLIQSSTTSNSDSSEKISPARPEKNSEALRRGSNTSNTESTNILGINEKGSIKNNGIDIVPSSSNESNAPILSSSGTVPIEHLKNAETGARKSPRDESIDPELLAHPAYVTLLRDYSNLKDQSAKLSGTVTKAETENQRLAAESNGELHAQQLEAFEKTIEQLKHDLKQANASHELLNKEYILANKERESMVMKYAISEKQLIDTQRAREYAERKVNEALKEQELLHNKLKQVQGERTRICNILDGKCHELTDAQKEVDRLKEELSMREVKLKWTQNKLKTELETFKENQQKLDKAMLRINEMKEECEQVRKESQETIRKFQQSEENKVVTLDHQLKEQQARLILERHVTEDKEMSRLQLQKEVETLKQRQHTLIEENNTLSLKVQNLEKERLNYENNLSNLKVIADQRQKEIVDLVGKVSQLETLKLQLKHKEQLLSSNEAEVERLRQSNAELQSDMEWCREREAHMLDFTEKLTDKNVRLQSEFTSIEAKNEQLELEQGPLHDQIKELSSKVKSLEISLASEKSKRTEECELLARHVAEQTQLARNLAQKLEDCQGENAVLRRKQQISVKEMTKELQQCKKRLDAFETGSPSNSLDRTSRTGSSSSLSTGETLNGAVSDNSNSGDNILQSVEPDRQTLIDRIVKLQRIRVRQAEKLDFLEEHTRTLVNELQKKTKIIKNYILHENPDAMGSNERDRNKAELARHGGIMASVYNQRVSDDNMTLELSLEMNQKLQAVLEDTLLKNITLKDSIDTLGGEIARLTMQTKQRQ